MGSRRRQSSPLWLSSPYSEDIHRYLKSRELERPLIHFQSPQLELRPVYVNWIQTVADKCRFLTPSVHLAVYLLDLFMDNHNVTGGKLGVAALACLLIASKFENEDGRCPDIKSLIKLLATRPSRETSVRDVVRMERFILQSLSWRLNWPTAALFAEYYRVLAVIRGDTGPEGRPAQELKVNVQWAFDIYLDRSFFILDLLNMLPSHVAASCLLAARIHASITPPWPPRLADLIGIDYEQLIHNLAPPPPPHEDFAYHWKKLIKHYLDVTNSRNVPIELTNIPARFDQILKILAKEDDEIEDDNRPGPCLEYLLQHSLLDLLATLASSDEPPGMRQHVFQFTAKFLSNVQMPLFAHNNVFQPLQRLVSQCDGTAPGPTESYEVQFLLGLAAVIRRNPSLVPVFTSSTESCETSPENLRRRSSCCSSEVSCLSSACGSELSGATPQQPAPAPPNNPLFAPLVTSIRSKTVRLLSPPLSGRRHSVDPPPPLSSSAASSSDDNKSLVVDDSAQFPLLDAAISYIQSPDCQVRVKACQVIMLLVSLPDTKAAEVMVSDTLLLSRLVARLGDLYHGIPSTTDPGAVDEMHVSWGLDMASAECLSVEGSRQLASFLAWYDFCDQLLAEAHSTIGQSLTKEIQEKFLAEIFNDDVLSQPLAITILAKLFKVAASALLNKALSEWLVGEIVEKEQISSKKSTTFRILLSNWSCQRSNLTLETLRFFEVVLDKGNPHVLRALALVYLDSGGFLDASTNTEKQEELDDSSRVDRVVNSFVNLVPVGLRSAENGGYEQYLAESQRQYNAVLAALKRDGVDPYRAPPPRLVTAAEPENGRRRELFYEGPFLRALFNALGNIPYQPYEVNLELTGIVSKLCLRPEHCLSLYLVDSALVQLTPEATTLHSVLHRVATLLAAAVMARPDYENCLRATRLRLITDQNTQPLVVGEDKWNTTFENIVVIEELCKELAAIAYVKTKHKMSLT